jgi:hypothetical protein
MSSTSIDNMVYCGRFGGEPHFSGGFRQLVRGSPFGEDCDPFYREDLVPVVDPCDHPRGALVSPVVGRRKDGRSRRASLGRRKRKPTSFPGGFFTKRKSLLYFRRNVRVFCERPASRKYGVQNVLRAFHACGLAQRVAESSFIGKGGEVARRYTRGPNG